MLYIKDITIADRKGYWGNTTFYEPHFDVNKVTYTFSKVNPRALDRYYEPYLSSILEKYYLPLFYISFIDSSYRGQDFYCITYYNTGTNKDTTYCVQHTSNKTWIDSIYIEGKLIYTSEDTQTVVFRNKDTVNFDTPVYIQNLITILRQEFELILACLSRTKYWWLYSHLFSQETETSDNSYMKKYLKSLQIE